LSDELIVYSMVAESGTSVWKWADTVYYIGNSLYPRLLPSADGKTGMITRTRLTELVKDSHEWVTATPVTGSTTSGEVYLRFFVEQITSGDRWTIIHAGSTLQRDYNHVFFVKDAVTTDITDESGNVLVQEFHIPAGETVTSISGDPNGVSGECEIAIRYNVPNLLTVVGNVDELQTTAKGSVVDAINELFERING
jgi:hypothetical protein